MKHLFTLFAAFLLLQPAFSQSTDEKINSLKQQLQNIEQQKLELFGKIEDLKLNKIHEDYDKVGWPSTNPGEEVVKHAAYRLVYSEKHEQAKWVAHIILPDVTSGTVFRTNDFRPDPLIKTGSAVETDYFIKKLNADSTYSYDAFGYDRGHLAPSADFRWSQKALSESYYYSNMSPQLADFNRISWALLEDAMRNYLYRNNNTQLYVVTGPVLEDNLPVIERGINKVSIPSTYWKVALDLNNNRAIGFIMPNKKNEEPLETFTVTINDVEKLSGIDFFSNLPDDLEEKLESQKINSDWIPELAAGDVEPFDQENLPKGYFNTVVAKNYMNQKSTVTVVGTVVAARISQKGNLILNLDRQFPRQVFSVFVKKEDLVNFSYNGEKFLAGKQIAVKGKVLDMQGTPTIYVENEKQVSLYDEK